MRTFLLVLFATALVHALEVGDKAPALDSVTWIKGGPVALGKLPTVVEFWATWCGPCKISIPHLTKLAKRHADKIAVIGLSDEEALTVKPFVDGQGAQMDYAVGLADERLHGAYMEGKPGIPQAFVVGVDGIVLWTGHPMELDRVLDAVAAGTFDRAAETKRSRRNAELQALLQQDPAGDERGVLTKVLAKTREILAEEPTAREALQLQLGVAKHFNDSALVRSTLAGIPVDALDGDQAAELALSLVREEDARFRHADLALAFARRAVAAEPAAAAAHAALAAVLHSLGLLDQAIASQERAAKADPAGEATMLVYYREAQRLGGLVRDGKPITPPAAPAAEAAPVGTTPPATLPNTLVP